MSLIEILAVIGIAGFIIYQQFAGQFLRGKRLIVLPAVLTVVGFFDLRGHHLSTADITWIALGAAGSLAIGLAFGLMTRLEARDGVLWGKLPLPALLLWAAMIAWRVVIMVVAARMGAHVAASTAPLLFTLGLNRVGQAAVITLRAMASGIPFAPEKDGRTFLAGAFGGHEQGMHRTQGHGTRSNAEYDSAGYAGQARGRY